MWKGPRKWTLSNKFGEARSGCWKMVHLSLRFWVWDVEKRVATHVIRTKRKYMDYKSIPLCLHAKKGNNFQENYSVKFYFLKGRKRMKLLLWNIFTGIYLRMPNSCIVHFENGHSTVLWRKLWVIELKENFWEVH